jgi:hypothetical protein
VGASLPRARARIRAGLYIGCRFIKIQTLKNANRTQKQLKPKKLGHS